MPLILDNSGAVFLHIHKTGGTWVREALTAAGVCWHDEGYQHWDYSTCQHLSPDGLRFTVVRNPYRWYRSLWVMRMESGWGGDLPPRELAEDSFPVFLYRCTQELPGYLSAIYRRYVCPGVVVLKTLQVRAELGGLLRALGEPHNELRLSYHPPTNCGQRRWLDQARYTPMLARRLYRSECWAFHEFGWEENSWENL